MDSRNEFVTEDNIGYLIKISNINPITELYIVVPKESSVIK